MSDAEILEHCRNNVVDEIETIDNSNNSKAQREVIDLKTAIIYIDNLKNLFTTIESLEENAYLRAHESIQTSDEIIIAQKLTKDFKQRNIDKYLINN